MNLTPRVAEKRGRRLLHRSSHPLKTAKDEIFRHLQGFKPFDDLDPRVSLEANFDTALIPPGHHTRRPAEVYYLDDRHCLRTHMVAHHHDLLSRGYTRFVTAGDIYKNCLIDTDRSPVAHQVTALGLSHDPGANGVRVARMLLADLLRGRNTRMREAYSFPFNARCVFEADYSGQWLKVMDVAVLPPALVEAAGLVGETGWVMRLGLDRMAMLMFEIPDIRYLWVDDGRFLSQFRDGVVARFRPYSTMPLHQKDVTFVVPDGFNILMFCEIVREIGGDTVQSLRETQMCMSGGKMIRTYRIVYRSLDRTLTSHQIEATHTRVCRAIEQEIRGELRDVSGHARVGAAG